MRPLRLPRRRPRSTRVWLPSRKPKALATGAKLSAAAKAAYTKARDKFAEATKADPNLAQAWNGLGYSNRKLGDYKTALTAYDKAIELRMGYPEATEYRGEAYLALNRPEDAKQAYLDLFATHRELAAKLLESMKKWATTARNKEDAADMKDFIEERTKIAAQTVALTRDATTTGWNWSTGKSACGASRRGVAAGKRRRLLPAAPSRKQRIHPGHGDQRDHQPRAQCGVGDFRLQPVLLTQDRHARPSSPSPPEARRLRAPVRARRRAWRARTPPPVRWRASSPSARLAAPSRSRPNRSLKFSPIEKSATGVRVAPMRPMNPSATGGQPPSRPTITPVTSARNGGNSSTRRTITRGSGFCPP